MFGDKKELKRLAEQLRHAQLDEEQVAFYTESMNPLMIEVYEQLMLYLEIQEQREKSYQEMRRQYQQMLANISHDFKTPLTVIKGLSELMDFEAKSPEENEQYLEKMRQKVDETLKMTEDFFEINKLDAKDTVLERAPLNLGELCRKELLAQYDVLVDAGLEMEVDIPKAPVMVSLNEQAVQRVLNNLLTNALKYGNAGGVIGVKVTADDDEVRLSVWDRGKGIDEKYYNHVFERLFTLEDSRNKNYSGSGLGLTIIKRLVENQGGTITLMSKPYEYTEFVVSFPVE